MLDLSTRPSLFAWQQFCFLRINDRVNMQSTRFSFLSHLQIGRPSDWDEPRWPVTVAPAGSPVPLRAHRGEPADPGWVPRQKHRVPPECDAAGKDPRPEIRLTSESLVKSLYEYDHHASDGAGPSRLCGVVRQLVPTAGYPSRDLQIRPLNTE
jgi:hypothetical protein